MASSEDTISVWQALDLWAQTLMPWQRAILAKAISNRTLSDAQIDEVYILFLENSKLREKTSDPHFAIDVTGRPTDALAKKLRLVKIDGLEGINAIPTGTSITFSPTLTIVYGRNGAGKSGFARLIANACFSRHKPKILGNIYDDAKPVSPTGNFHTTVDGIPQKAIVFTANLENGELRRISFFDATVARQHVSETAPFEFKPAGFDVFPEMARVYGLLAQRLEAEIKLKTHDIKFKDSFIGVETQISKSVAALNASTDLDAIRTLAIYGPTEQARLEAVDRQLIALKSSSQKDVLIALKQARGDIDVLAKRITSIRQTLSVEKSAIRNERCRAAKEAEVAAVTMGSEEFRRSFFNAVGTIEWQTFAKSVHALARKEGPNYPTESDRCLLCERPLDETSQKHVASLLAFIEGDAQKTAERTKSELQKEVSELLELDLTYFAEGTRVREHIHKLNPKIELEISAFIASASSARDIWLEALNGKMEHDSTVQTKSIENVMLELSKRIVDDIDRLEKVDPTKAIQSLELEHQTLRHREVLSQLMPSIEAYVQDAKWRVNAHSAKVSLSPRQITEKEKELFGAVIGDAYRNQLAHECETLDCAVPIELRTSGQKGKTVRSLSIKGHYQPEAILSEGEQKAVALADFLTEVSMSEPNSGIVLDDPVTSQDHERKELIAKRLVLEASKRQVIVFTHDLPFLNQIISHAEHGELSFEAHWIDRYSDGRPGQVSLNDVPATSKAYDTVERAKACLAEAQKCTGMARHDAICKGMGSLRRTIEETVVKKLLKNVVPRWSDRVMVTGLRKVAWDHILADALVEKFEELSAYIEGHSHSDEAVGAPPEIKDLDEQINAVDALIKRARPERQ